MSARVALALASFALLACSEASPARTPVPATEPESQTAPAPSPPPTPPAVPAPEAASTPWTSVERRATFWMVPVDEARSESVVWDEPVATLDGRLVFVDLAAPGAAARLGEVTGPVSLRVDHRAISDASVREAITALSHSYDLCIELRGEHVTDADLARLVGLPRLRVLRFFYTDVTNAGLVHLEGMTSLRRLDVGGRVTGAGLAHLRGLRQLEQLTLGGLPIHDADLAELDGMTELRELHLGSTQVTDAGLVHLAAHPHLRELYLYDCPITDAGLIHIEPLRELEVVWLHDTPVSDAAIDHLLRLPALREASLYRTQVTADGAHRLLDAIPGIDVAHASTF